MQERCRNQEKHTEDLQVVHARDGPSLGESERVMRLGHVACTRIRNSSRFMCSNQDAQEDSQNDHKEAIATTCRCPQSQE